MLTNSLGMKTFASLWTAGQCHDIRTVWI